MTDLTNTRISRVGGLIYIHSRGSTWGFGEQGWNEFCRMISDFNTTGVREIKNYEDLPPRTPLHANTPRVKTTLDDLI